MNVDEMLPEVRAVQEDLGRLPEPFVGEALREVLLDQARARARLRVFGDQRAALDVEFTAALAANDLSLAMDVAVRVLASDYVLSQVIVAEIPDELADAAVDAARRALQVLSMGAAVPEEPAYRFELGAWRQAQAQALAAAEAANSATLPLFDPPLTTKLDVDAARAWDEHQARQIVWRADYDAWRDSPPRELVPALRMAAALVERGEELVRGAVSVAELVARANATRRAEGLTWKLPSTQSGLKPERARDLAGRPL
jgi:hypothetical protein